MTGVQTCALPIFEGRQFDQEGILAAAEACYLKARPLDNTDFVMGWRKQMARPFALRALEELREKWELRAR